MAIVPPPVKPAGTIRIISPAGPIDRDSVESGIKVLQNWGFHVSLSPFSMQNNGYLSSSDDRRLNDLLDALTDPFIDGVICSRGGYGTVRLLPMIDWDVLSKLPPKVFLGFSDIGALQVNLWSRCGWVTFSGPQTGAIGGRVSVDSVKRVRTVLSQPNAAIDLSVYSFQHIDEHNRTFNGEYPFIPICLSILTSLSGTRFMPDFKDCILCIEDINEAPYKIDRMLWQLVNSGALRDIAGIIIGKFIYQNNDITERILPIIVDAFKPQAIPVWSGMPYGHVEDFLTLPVGGKIKIIDKPVSINP